MLLGNEVSVVNSPPPEKWQIAFDGYNGCEKEKSAKARIDNVLLPDTALNKLLLLQAFEK
jgi:hypothetical protein